MPGTHKTMKCKVTDIFADYGKNWRQDWRYASIKPSESFDLNDEKAKGSMPFYEDVFLNGVNVDIEVVELTEAQIAEVLNAHNVKAKYRVARGHRRFYTVNKIRELYPDRFTELSCIVHKGLTPVEEQALKFDAKGVEELNEFEVYTAIVQLFGMGCNQTEIAKIVGQQRGYVQDRIYIFEMPPVVRENYGKRFVPVNGKPPVKGTDYIGFTFSQVDKLHKAMNADVAALIPLDSESSAWLKMWNEIATATVSGPKPNKAESLAEMEKRKGFIKGCEALEVAHGFYDGSKSGDLGKAAEIYRALEDKAGKVKGLELRINDLEIQIAEKDREIAALVEQLDSMTPVPSEPVSNGSV